MARKMGRPRVEPAPDELLGRISRYQELLFAGSQRRMAHALGFSQALVSKIFNRIQRPTESFLRALAAQPGVNYRWLTTGDGEPLLPPTAGTLPVANVILPGPPAAYTGLLHGERYAVAATLDRETRYWLRVGGHFAIASVSDIGIAAGDLLLMETSRDHLDRADIVAGQLCTIAISSESGVTHAFARIALEAGKLLAWVYDDQFATGDAGTNKGTARAVLLESMINPSRMRITKARKKSSTQVASEGALAPQGEYRAFPASDHPAVRQLTGTNEIVGIALLLQRPLIPLQARLPSHAHVGNQEDLNDRETEVASQENELQVVDAPNVASVTVVARRGN